jgi:hypothetical protein
VTPARALASGLAMVALALAMAGCGGEQRATADAYWTPETTDNDKPLRETEALETSATARAIEAEAKPRALVGVRPDLSLATAAVPATRCPCLAVEVGSPGDAKFRWQAGAPAAGAGALAVAVSARGVACPGGDPDEANRRPSISAVDIEGSDVVIEIEELPDGAPLASGALIPEPGPGGSIYVRGRDKSVVYARSPDRARCKVR